MTLKQIFLQRLLTVTLICVATSYGQEAVLPPQTLEEALHRLSDAAGVIFVGEVVKVRHSAGDNGASGVVEIDFRVDQAIRGCSADGVYTLREWAGLWSGGDQRYRVGQRLLMLLHTPGASGISSPVGGMDGAIPIHGSAAGLSPQAAASGTVATASSIDAAGSATATETPAPPVADLRWVGTQVQRSISYMTNATAERAAAAKIATTATTQSAPNLSDASTAAQQAPVPVVVDMLASWQGTHAAQ